MLCLVNLFDFANRDRHEMRWVVAGHRGDNGQNDRPILIHRCPRLGEGVTVTLYEVILPR